MFMNNKTQLKSLFTQYWGYLAVHAACELRLFDKLVEGPMYQEALRRQVGVEESCWEPLLKALESEGLIHLEHHVSLTAKGELLTENHSESLLFACLHWGGEHLNAWQALSFTLQTGRSAFKQLYGKGYFDYLVEHPDRLHAYHLAMYEYARDDYRHIGSTFDFSPFASVLDIGGGYGALIAYVKAAFPAIKCKLLDLPAVVSNVEIEGVEVIGASFLAPLPVQSDCIILSRVLHDWPDHACAVILGNCFDALPDQGSLLVIEILEDQLSSRPSLLTLNMAAICESQERTMAAYKVLLANAGFQIEDVRPLNNLQYIINAKK